MTSTELAERTRRLMSGMKVREEVGTQQTCRPQSGFSNQTESFGPEATAKVLSTRVRKKKKKVLEKN